MSDATERAIRILEEETERVFKVYCRLQRAAEKGAGMKLSAKEVELLWYVDSHFQTFMENYSYEESEKS